MEDIAAALTGSLPRNGSAPMDADLKMGGFKITGLANGVASTDAATVGQTVTLTGTQTLTNKTLTAPVINNPTVTGLDASATAKGLVELATDAEALAKTDATKALTPDNLAALGSTATFAGLVELATTAEAAAGTDTTRAVTPAGLSAAIPVMIADLALGAIGTDALCTYTTQTTLAPGTNVAGSTLRYANSGGDNVGSPIPSGTWNSRGWVEDRGGEVWQTTTFRRML